MQDNGMDFVMAFVYMYVTPFDHFHLPHSLLSTPPAPKQPPTLSCLESDFICLR